MALIEPADLAKVRGWPAFAEFLLRLHRQTGLSYPQVERSAKALASRDRRYRSLPHSTLHETLNGHRRIDRQMLESLLTVWKLSGPEQGAILAAWTRVNETVSRGPTGGRRVDEAHPHELGVHEAIVASDCTDELPRYVARDFDDDLAELIAKGTANGCFVVLVGNSSVGKTRSLYEAIYSVARDWWIVQPDEVAEIVELAQTPTDRTIVWLDELDRFLSTDRALDGTTVNRLKDAGMVVVGTLWSEEYHARRHTENRRLFALAKTVWVSESLSQQERAQAVELASGDSRLRTALASPDAGLTQVLAAGPELVTRWQQAPNPYARAIITAAADARRLGVHGPLPGQLLCAAMTDYLQPKERVLRQDQWLDRAMPYATAKLHGDVSALVEVSFMQPGKSDGYQVADYLVQHIRRIRRAACPPESLWSALTEHISSHDDLHRLALAARDRLRYQHAARALWRLADSSLSAAVELTALLVRQDRVDEAVVVLGRHWAETKPRDQRLIELMTLRTKANEMRSTAAYDPRSRTLLFEFLADGGVADGFRVRANAGDASAADQLADLLAERGCFDELRGLADAGHRFAGDRLANLLAGQGRIDELRERAGAGDSSAVRELDRLERSDPAGITQHPLIPIDQAELAELRVAADAGDTTAAERLTDLLFNRRELGELLGEVNAGTFGAADRYLAALTAESGTDRQHLDQIRAFGLTADGSPASQGVAW